MSQYYVDKDPQPDTEIHLVHVLGCVKLPPDYKRESLGDFNSCESALSEAKQKHTQVNGCASCSYSCHRSL